MNDDDFLRDLTDRADRAAPDVRVHTDRVIPRAHHRRRVIRTTQTVGVIAALAIIGGGITWAWTDRPEPAEPQPTVTSSPTPTPTPTPAPTPESTPTPTTPPQPPAPVIPEVSAEFPYWHSRVVNNVPALVDAYGSEWETWVALDRIGLDIYDGDQSLAYTLAPGYSSTTVRIDGVDMFLPQAAPQLPTDPPALRTALLSTDLDKIDSAEAAERDPELTAVMGAWDLVELGGLVPAEVRAAALQILVDSPLATVTDGSDDTGRPGIVIELAGPELAYRLVVDPDRLVILQIDGHDGVDSILLYQEAVATLPMDPDDVTVFPDW